MDVTGTTKSYESPPPMFVSQVEATLDGSIGCCTTGTKNLFLDSFTDPLCKLNLKETSDFVRSFPMAYNGTEGRGILEVSSQRKDGAGSVTKRNVEVPPTPGRPIFSFSVGSLSRKGFPSKWDDAEKWLASSTACHDSPPAIHHGLKPSESFKMSKQCNVYNKPQHAEVFAEKSRVTDEKVSKVVSSFQQPLHLDHHSSVGAVNEILTVSTDVLLKDKFTNKVEQINPNFRCSEPKKEGFVFANASEKSKKNATSEVVNEVKHRDVGTEMTPIGSSTTSQCHTPFKTASPARHNTPANRSGPLALSSINNTNTIDIKELQECHLAKLQLGSQFDSVTSNWSSREEEEEDISKSLRHFEINNELRKSVSETRACAWEEEEKNKCCLRYQREEAKIQAWVNLQNAKAEAQSRKLEICHMPYRRRTILNCDPTFPRIPRKVKIQKMRSNLEEKLMKRMTVVHRKAEEWRTTAQLQHSEQIQKVNEQAHRTMNRQNSSFTGQRSCGCFPCNNRHK